MGAAWFTGHTGKSPYNPYREFSFIRSTLYLAAEDKGGLPELRRVILAFENNVVMEENLELGLQRLFGGGRILPGSGKKERRCQGFP